MGDALLQRLRRSTPAGGRRDGDRDRRRLGMQLHRRMSGGADCALSIAERVQPEQGILLWVRQKKAHVRVPARPPFRGDACLEPCLHVPTRLSPNIELGSFVC
jgi:hypothetical protein